MTEKDFEIVCNKIDADKEFLNNVSQEIWKLPELLYKEVHAHAILTCALHRHGFKVQKHYFMPTAFRGEYCSKSGEGTTVAILLEYDALAGIGHACGHNLIAEAGLAAAIGVKEAMEQDPTIKGKLVVLGTPAEEGGAGKIRLIELGAFDGVDVALMVHPAPRNVLFPQILSSVKGSVTFKGKESHAAALPWNGINALDAAVACYQNIALLRQQIKPTSRVNVIITKGGTAVNVIPAESTMDILVRASTMGELKNLRAKVEACITSAAQATGCEVEIHFKDENCYENLITNKVLINLYKNYVERLGEGATVAILLEYDALPFIGHACGHNLIAEAGLAASIGVKEAMEQDIEIMGKLIVLGTPAEEGGGGKIKLIELGAFDGVDVALMVHPTPSHILSPHIWSSAKGSVTFKGKESHAAAFPWNGINALDAAVACYQNIALLRQQLRPTSRVHFNLL